MYRLLSISASLLAMITPMSVRAAAESVLYAYDMPDVAGGLAVGVTRDAKGNLIGATTAGAQVFELTRAKGAWNFSVIQTIPGTPLSSVVFDAAGNAYGTSVGGGNAGCGSVIELSPTKSGPWKQTMIHSFNNEQGNGDGCDPETHLTLDSAGNLYGTTVKGGGGHDTGNEECYDGCGSVFELSRQPDGSWSERVIHAFAEKAGSLDGQTPYGWVAFDSKGNLWGTTQQGGTGTCDPGWPNGCGTVYELSPTKTGDWKEVLVYSFQNEATGWDAFAGPIIDSQDNIYGTVINTSGAGAVFKLSQNGQGSVSESLIYTFPLCDTQEASCHDGVFPIGGLSFDKVGNLYGTTIFGGGKNLNCNQGEGGFPLGCGTVFKLVPNGSPTWSEKVLYRFLGTTDGNQPFPDGLAMDNRANLFGTTVNGGNLTCGSAGCGVVFEIKQ